MSEAKEGWRETHRYNTHEQNLGVNRLRRQRLSFCFNEAFSIVEGRHGGSLLSSGCVVKEWWGMEPETIQMIWGVCAALYPAAYYYLVPIPSPLQPSPSLEADLYTSLLAINVPLDSCNFISNFRSISHSTLPRTCAVNAARPLLKINPILWKLRFEHYGTSRSNAILFLTTTTTDPCLASGVAKNRGL
jgi:hypothetical protein